MANLKANQYRIGNLMRDALTGALLRVDGLHNEIQNERIDYYVMDRDKFPLPDGWQAEPIPLTQEWLDRTMFEKSSNLICGDYTIRIDEIGCLGIWLETGRYSLMDWNTGDIFTSHDNRIKYVHQLQNLYFALTGEELEFK